MFSVCERFPNSISDPAALPVAKGSGSLFFGAAVVTNTLLPHTIGLALARPGIGVFQRIFAPVLMSHVVGGGAPGATPDPPGPRNDGHSRAAAPNTVAPPLPASTGAALRLAVVVGVAFGGAGASPVRVKATRRPPSLRSRSVSAFG